MKKLKSFLSLVTVAAMLSVNILPVFALGEVDLGTTNSAPVIAVQTPAPTITPTVPQTTSTISTTTTSSTTSTPSSTAPVTTTPPTTNTNTPIPQTNTSTTTTVGDTIVSTNTSTSTNTTDITNTTSNVSVTVSDTTPPVISDIVSASVLPTEATVAWVTDELAVSHFRYGTTTNYGSMVTLGTSGALIHAATMLNLTAGTTYYYCINATDLFGNNTESCGHQFTTATAALQADTNPPTISSVVIAPITTTSATVAWSTDELANGHVEYGTTQNYGSTVSSGNDYTLIDSVNLPNLLPNTEYHYHITSRDEIGNTASTPDETFMTEAVSTAQVTVTTPTETINTPTPVTPTTISLLISGIEASSLGESSATISWMTDVPSDSQVEYGNSINLGSTTSLSSNLTTNHSVTISNLTSDANYIFRVKSKPLSASIATISNLHEFSTLITPIFVSTPANITLVSSSGVATTSASVSWTTDITTTGHVEYGITTEYGQVVASASDQSSHTVSLSELTPDTTYHFRVKALNTAGDITYSEDQTFTTSSLPILSITTNSTSSTLPPLTLSAPTALSNISVAGHDETSAVLSWNAASVDSDAAMFTDIRYSTNMITESNWSSATSAQVTPIVYPDLSPNGMTRTYLVAGLAPNTTYYFSVKSKYGESDWSAISNVVSVITLATLPVDTSSSGLNQNTNTGNGDLVSTTSDQNTVTANSSNIVSGETTVQTTTSLPIAHPTFINATGRNQQIVFTWDNPNEADFVRTVIVRKTGSYPTSPTDGTTVYESDGKTFTDENVINGTTYYYSFYSYDHAKTYSEPVHVSLAPVAPIAGSISGGGSISASGTVSSPGGGVSSAQTGSVQLPAQFVLHETPVIMPAEPAEHFTTVWKKGDQDIEVEHLQHVLQVDGEFYPSEKIDGVFGSITEKGVKQFQAKYYLLQSGITDQPTQKQLNISSQSLVMLDVPDDITALETNLRQGDKNAAVEDVQQLLADEGSYTGPIDGQFGQKTRSAVRTFQAKYFIKSPDGVVGPKTRHILKILTGL